MFHMKQFKAGTYRHYKGKEYQVLGIAQHSETWEGFVVYRVLYETDEYQYGSLWVRPLTLFMETVVVAGVVMPRFSYVGE